MSRPSVDDWNPWDDLVYKAKLKSFNEHDVKEIVAKLRYAADCLEASIGLYNMAGTAEDRQSLLDEKRYDEYEMLVTNETNAMNRINSAQKEINSAKINLALFLNNHCG